MKGLPLLLGGMPVADAFIGKPEGRQKMAITVVTLVIGFALTGPGYHHEARNPTGRACNTTKYPDKCFAVFPWP